MLSGLMAGPPRYGEGLNNVLHQLEVFDEDDFSDEAQQKVFSRFERAETRSVALGVLSSPKHLSWRFRAGFI